MQHDVAGDPCTGVKWTRRTTRNIAAELQTLGIAVGAKTVARLLKDLAYCLRVNHKRVSRGSGPDRNEQFEYSSAQRTSFAERGLPIVSIDSKKKEMVGNFKNPGNSWQREPELVNDHDSPPTPRRWRGRTASTTYGRTEAWSSWARTTTRPTSPSTTSSDGGRSRAERAIQGQRSCWCWPTAAAATAPAAASSSMACRLGFATPMASVLRSATTPPGPRSGIPSSIGSSARSARTGRVVRWQLRDDPQLHPHHTNADGPASDRTPRRPGVPEGREDTRSMDGQSDPRSSQDPAAARLYDSSEAMKVGPNQEVIFHGR